MIVGKQKLSHEKEREREPWKIIKVFFFLPVYHHNGTIVRLTKGEADGQDQSDSGG